MLQEFKIFDKSLKVLGNEKLLINTINAYSYNMSQKDPLFKQSLLESDVLIPDGISVVWAMKLLTGLQLKKIAGAELFFYEMQRVEKIKGKCFFLGSSQETLNKINHKVRIEFPNVEVQMYSPPFKLVFSESENAVMIEKVNAFTPDVLFVGMTAPKQEKWAYTNFKELEVGHVCSIGAVFDFYAGTVKRAPDWLINLGLEWLFRLIKEPKRMWKRYLIGNTEFLYAILKEKLTNQKV
jgi:N-acetylglucosaminyldiphosphoundecaprenol N-acetyl-beta-D-mannosaminyltransferase